MWSHENKEKESIMPDRIDKLIVTLEEVKTRLTVIDSSIEGINDKLNELEQMVYSEPVLENKSQGKKDINVSNDMIVHSNETKPKFEERRIGEFEDDIKAKEKKPVTVRKFTKRKKPSTKKE